MQVFLPYYVFFTDVPAAPVSLQAENIQSRLITLKWTQAPTSDGESDITRYLLQYINLLSNVYNETVIETPTPIKSVEIGHLQPYTNYSLRMRGVSIVGLGMWSVLTYFRTDSEGK